jgi:hypothetical protein
MAWLETLAAVCQRFNWVCHGYCQRTNHYHMLIETPDANLSQFAAQRARAMAKYVSFVHEGARLPSVWSRLQGQVYLGSEKFVEGMQTLVDNKPSLAEIPRAQRRALKRALSDYARAHARDEAIALAYLSGQHTMAAIAAHFRVHYTTVSRLVKAYEVARRREM